MAFRRVIAKALPRTQSNNAQKSFSTRTLSPQLSAKLSDIDPDIFDIIEHEKQRQRESLSLIPSENFTSKPVLEALGSIMQNKYSEGYPGARYYGGNEFIDMAEIACQNRALELYKLDPALWAVNVQTLSGSPANFAVYTGTMEPHDRMMALDLPHGGHLSHGYATPNKKISAVSKYFECLPYRLDESTGLIDYDALEKNALLYRPKLIIMGASAYARHIDYARMRKIADLNKSLLMCDMAHISGLVAAGVMPDPFEWADIVTTTTHKSLRGPRGSMVFMRKGLRSVDKKGNETMYNLEEPINAAVFPGHQGGPHNHTITALAVALKLANTPEFIDYQKQVMSNSQVLANEMMGLGYDLVSGGTDNHLCLTDLRPKGVNGAKVERVLELGNIALNKNTVPGDLSALNPGGIRMGTPALTSRGFDEKDMKEVANFVHRGITIATAIQAKAGKKTNKAFKESLESGEDFGIDALKSEVVSFAKQFPPVGYDLDTMKYQ